MHLLSVNWYSVFYWVGVANGVKDFFDTFSNVSLFFAIIFMIVCIILTVIKLDPSNQAEDDQKSLAWWLTSFRRLLIWSVIITTITWAGWVFTPTKKDALLIIAGGSAATFITSDSSAKALPADLTRYLHVSLREQIKDLNAEAKKELGIPTTKKETLLKKATDLTKEQLIEYIKGDSTLDK